LFFEASVNPPFSKMGAHSQIRSNLTENNNEAKKIMKLNQNPPRSRNNSENNCNAYVIEDDGMSYSVVPFFKKQKSTKRDPKSYTWSINKVTQRRTITRKDYYASGKWNETPASPMLPVPPKSWLQPKSNFNHDENSMSSTYETDSSISSNSDLECCAIVNCTNVKSETQCSDSGYYE